MANPMNVSAERLRAQVTAVLEAWGMEPDAVRQAAEVMVETDLAGIDSHGVAVLKMYEDLKALGSLNLRPRPKVLREGPVTALIDADNGLGHPAAIRGMELAIAKAKANGLGAVAVRNSAHFGAAGYYAALAPPAGLIGLVTSTTRLTPVLPTRSQDRALGTNPIAFAAPARRNRAFLLDMSTSTTALNKVRAYSFREKPLPPGWVLDEKGRPETDSPKAFARISKDGPGGLTPIGGTPEMGSHKGYGLAVMVQILAGTLGGASFSPLRNRTQRRGQPDNIGHFFFALDPAAFRPEGEFEDDLDQAIDFFRALTPIDPDEPVLVAGDPEAASREQRLRDGIPIPDSLAGQIRGVCERCGAAFLLAEG